MLLYQIIGFATSKSSSYFFGQRTDCHEAGLADEILIDGVSAVEKCMGAFENVCTTQ